MFEGILGHQKQREFLTKALQKGTLPHAYVFAGPESVGKKLVAKKLAYEMLGVELPLLAYGRPPLVGEEKFHPDLIEISGDDGIKIEQIRELVYKLSLLPYQAKYKIAILDKADEMSVEAANALLKMLEEPKGYTYIFLITSNPNKLPKTILSRCQKIIFGPVDLAREQTEETQRADEYFQVFSSTDLPDKLVAAYEIADLETAEIKNMLQAWVLKLEKELLINPEKKLAKQIQEILESLKLLEQNVNSKLLMTNLMIKS